MRRPLALVLLILLAPLAGAALAGQSLVLSRGDVREDGSFKLYLSGAQPNQTVILSRFLGLPPEDSGVAQATGFLWKQVTADPAGDATIEVGPEDWTLPPGRQVGEFFLMAQAFAEGEDGALATSNPELLKASPVLYLLVEGLPGSAAPTRVMRFNVVTGELGQVGANVVRHPVYDPSDLYRRSHFDIAGRHEKAVFFESADDPTRLWSNRSANSLDRHNPQASLLAGERILDVRAVRDQSGVLALTGQATPDGRWRLRLRLLNADNMRWEAESTVMHADSALNAWLVVDEDSPRVFVANPSPGGDRIREFVISGDLVPGLWIPPTPEPSSEALFDFAVHGDTLVAVNASRHEDGGRLVVIDASVGLVDPMSTQRDAFEATFKGQPRDFELIRRDQGLMAVVLLEGGQVWAYTIEPGLGVTSAIDLRVIPGAMELAVSELLSSAFVLMSLGPDRRVVVRIDLDTGVIIPMEELSFSGTAQHLGVVGDPTEEWLFLLERVDEFQYDDTLISIGMDAETRTISRQPFRLPLNGTVTRIRVQ